MLVATAGVWFRGLQAQSGLDQAAKTDQQPRHGHLGRLHLGEGGAQKVHAALALAEPQAKLGGERVNGAACHLIVGVLNGALGLGKLALRRADLTDTQSHHRRNGQRPGKLLRVVAGASKLGDLFAVAQSIAELAEVQMGHALHQKAEHAQRSVAQPGGHGQRHLRKPSGFVQSTGTNTDDGAQAVQLNGGARIFRRLRSQQGFGANEIGLGKWPQGRKGQQQGQAAIAIDLLLDGLAVIGGVGAGQHAVRHLQVLQRKHTGFADERQQAGFFDARKRHLRCKRRAGEQTALHLTSDVLHDASQKQGLVLRHRAARDGEPLQAGLHTSCGASQTRQRLRLQAERLGRLPARRTFLGQRSRDAVQDALGFDESTATQRMFAGHKRIVQGPRWQSGSLKVMRQGCRVVHMVVVHGLYSFSNGAVQCLLRSAIEIGEQSFTQLVVTEAPAIFADFQHGGVGTGF